MAYDYYDCDPAMEPFQRFYLEDEDEFQRWQERRQLINRRQRLYDAVTTLLSPELDITRFSRSVNVQRVIGRGLNL